MNIILDITERKRTERKLRQSEEELADFFENATVGLHWIGPDGIILRVNRAELDLLGYRSDEYLGHHIREFHVDAQVIDDMLQRLQAGEDVDECKARLRCKDGSIRQVVISSSVRWDNGKFVHTRCFTRDTTEQHRAEEAIRALTARLSSDLAAMTRLQQVSARLVQAGNSSLLLHEILDAALDITGARQGNLQIVESGALKIVAQRGFDAAFLEFFERVHEGVGACGAAIHPGERVVVEDVETSPIFVDTPAIDAMRAAGMRAVQSTPLVNRSGVVLGMFSTHYDAPHRPSEGELRTLDLLARQAADFIERIQAETRLRESEERLRENEAALKDADCRKDEFLALLAHELRNPLAPLRMGLELIARGEDRPEVVQHVRGMLGRQVNQLVRLVDDLLDVSRINTGKVMLQRVPTSLAFVIQSGVEPHRAAAEAKGIDLTLELPSVDRVVEVDGARIVQVLSNLIQNAVKFTPADGTVRVEARIDAHPEVGAGEELYLVVTDSGMGIPEEVLPRIFEWFSQGDLRDQIHGGLGIGLALARKLVELHGGAIQGFSDGPNQGSRFEVRIPIPTVRRPVAVSSAREATAIQSRVVVIDDHRDAAESAALFLETLGCTVYIAQDPILGIDLVREVKPSIVLLDIGLPAIDGYEVCRRIRADSSSGPLKIIAVTGWGQPRDKERTAEAGFDAHLTKPVDPTILEELLVRIADSRPASMGSVGLARRDVPSAPRTAPRPAMRTCRVCGLPLGTDGDCADRHGESLERFRSTMRVTLDSMERTAGDLRALALRMDSRGELMAKQVHQQAKRSEEGAERIRKLLAERYPARREDPIG